MAYLKARSSSSRSRIFVSSHSGTGSLDERLPHQFVFNLQFRPIAMGASYLLSSYAPVDFAQFEREQHSLLSGHERLYERPAAKYRDDQGGPWTNHSTAGRHIALSIIEGGEYPTHSPQGC
jgi:hypothetical protein